MKVNPLNSATLGAENSDSRRKRRHSWLTLTISDSHSLASSFTYVVLDVYCLPDVNIPGTVCEPGKRGSVSAGCELEHPGNESASPGSEKVCLSGVKTLVNPISRSFRIMYML